MNECRYGALINFKTAPSYNLVTKLLIKEKLIIVTETSIKIPKQIILVEILLNKFINVSEKK